MHITVIHVFNQCFIIRENFRPHHHLTNQFGFIGNETTKTIMITQIDTQGFGDVYSGFFSTINKDVGRVATVKIEYLEEHFDHNTRTGHHSKIDHICHKQYTDGTNPNAQVSIQQKTQNHQYPIGDRKRHKYAHNVYKRRKAKHI